MVEIHHPRTGSVATTEFADFFPWFRGFGVSRVNSIEDDLKFFVLTPNILCNDRNGCYVLSAESKSALAELERQRRSIRHDTRYFCFVFAGPH